MAARGVDAYAPGSPLPQASSPPVGDAPPLLVLPDAALLDILAHLADPLALALTCRHLAGLLHSRGLQMAWLCRHGVAAQPWRAPAGRILTFAPLRGAPPRELAALMLQYVEAAGGGDGGCHNTLKAAAAAQRAGQVGCPRAQGFRLHAPAEDPLQLWEPGVIKAPTAGPLSAPMQAPLVVMRLLCPHAEILLLPYLAAGGHDALAAEAALELAAADGGPLSSAESGSSSAGSADGDWAPLSAAHPQLGEANVLRLALHAALRRQRWGAAEALLRARLGLPPLHDSRGAAINGGPGSSSSSGGSGGAPNLLSDQLEQRLGLEAAAQRAATSAAGVSLGLRGLDEAAARASCPPPLLRRLIALSAPDTGRAYLLPAAAGGGSAEAVAEVLACLGPSDVRCQLPQALCQAGRGGHVSVVRLLLANEQLSSRPLEVSGPLGCTSVVCTAWYTATLDILRRCARSFGPSAPHQPGA
jgi:hypothetical protein